MASAHLLRSSKLILGVFLVCLKAVQGCSTMASTAPATVDPTAAVSALEVIPVQGTIVEASGTTVGHLRNFRSPLPVVGASVELYLADFPTEEFDAEITNAVPLDRGWYAADVKLVHADARLALGASFDGRLVVRPMEPIACGETTP